MGFLLGRFFWCPKSTVDDGATVAAFLDLWSMGTIRLDHFLSDVSKLSRLAFLLCGFDQANVRAMVRTRSDVRWSEQDHSKRRDLHVSLCCQGDQALPYHFVFMKNMFQKLSIYQPSTTNLQTSELPPLEYYASIFLHSLLPFMASLIFFFGNFWREITFY